MALIETKNVRKTYPDGTEALRGVSFSIEKGEFLSIMGPSGSGKSTLLHIIGFLDRHTNGEYLFNGKRFDDFEPDELAKVRNKEMGFVFQMFNLLARESVVQNVIVPLYYSDVPEKEWEERAKKMIDLVGLSHRHDHAAKKLSGGERQRVAIARALVNEPEVIFADEPTGNLDSKAGDVVMDMFKQLNELGHTVVLITHEEDIAKRTNRIVHIRDGQVEKDEKLQ